VLTGSSSGDLQGQIDAGRSAAASLQTQISADEAQIKQTQGGLDAAQARLTDLQGQLNDREAQLRAVQTSLLAARDHLVALENRLRVASRALAANLVATYETGQPNLVNVILDSHGFTDLLEQVSFLQRIGRLDAAIVGTTRTEKAAVTEQADQLAVLERRDLILTNQVLTQRNDVAALRAALIKRQMAQIGARNVARGKLHALNTQLAKLEARAAAQAAAAAAAQNAPVPVGGIATDAGGLVQPPPGLTAGPTMVQEGRQVVPYWLGPVMVWV
jgi:peptidoglycan hydrolase CwlO-like protein